MLLKTALLAASVCGHLGAAMPTIEVETVEGGNCIVRDVKIYINRTVRVGAVETSIPRSLAWMQDATGAGVELGHSTILLTWPQADGE